MHSSKEGWESERVDTQDFVLLPQVSIDLELWQSQKLSRTPYQYHTRKSENITLPNRGQALLLRSTSYKLMNPIAPVWVHMELMGTVGKC